MELIEMLRNIVIREGFAAGRSLREISDETGLSVSEVLQREMDLHLIPADEAVARLNQGPHRKRLRDASFGAKRFGRLAIYPLI